MMSAAGASKFALRAFCDCLRVELECAGHAGARVTSAYPGAVATGINQRRLGSGARQLDFTHATTADAVADAIADAVARGRRERAPRGIHIRRTFGPHTSELRERASVFLIKFLLPLLLLP